MSALAVTFAPKAWLLVSPALFLIACFLPALEWENEDTARSRETMIGGMALLNSFFSILTGMPAGWANPAGLLALGLGLLGYGRASLVAGLLALLLSLTIVLAIGRKMPQQYSNDHKIIRLLPGCYFWIASFAAVPLLCWCQIRARG